MSSSPALASAAVDNLPPDPVVFGQSSVMRDIQSKLDRVANANVAVLISGESGTGKEIIATLLHRHSPWNTGPFVKVNCPAIPGTLMESELFGYEKGAFTGAGVMKPGRVEMAHRGTLFLDEIGELELGLQAKLLQLLQDGQFCRIGAQEDKKVEVRVVCATNRNLEEEVIAGTFRQDLYYRINVVAINLPPLRERHEDLPQLINYFIESFNLQFGRRASVLSASMMQTLQKYHWPGNIRELANLMKRYVILGTEDAINTELSAHEATSFDVNMAIPTDGTISLKKITRNATRELERKLILKVLQANNWNRKRTARVLNISYRALLYKMRDANLPAGRVRPDSVELAGD